MNDTPKPLKHIHVIDLTSKLPGPLGCSNLQKLGATITRIEDKDFKDPFIFGHLNNNEPNFEKWYNLFNGQKKTVRLDFNNEMIKNDLLNLINKSNGAILGLPLILENRLGLSDNELLERFKSEPKTIIKIRADHNQTRNMHDLNALAESGILLKYVKSKGSNNIIAPPFLPIAGISFAQEIVSNFLATHIEVIRKQKTIIRYCTLADSVKNNFSQLWSKEDRDNQKTLYFHNGKYPCYCIYKTKDNNYLAVATSSAKMWNRFLTLFDINLLEADQFNTSNIIFETISKTILSLNKEDIVEIIKNENICICLF